jgi:hypothetical protein
MAQNIAPRSSTEARAKHDDACSAATAALHDATKLVFDYFDTYNGPPRYAGAATGSVTGHAANGVTLADPAGHDFQLSL